MKDERPDLKEILNDKNDLIVQQTRRIRLLEDKLSEVRQKYLHLKVSMSMLR